ncbi:MAG: antibiotic biosynthesis monooxygenase family protein [Woeseia sp.]
MMLVTVEFALREGQEGAFQTALDKAHTCLEKYDGYLGEEPCRSLLDEENYISVFYFRDHESIEAWHEDADHIHLQQLGKNKIFSWDKFRIAEVQRQYGFNESKGTGLPTRQEYFAFANRSTRKSMKARIFSGTCR